MGITVTCILVLAISYLLFDRRGVWVNETAEMLVGLIDIICFMGLLCSITFICISHIGVDAKIEQNNITYESLIDKTKYLHSEYEDASEIMVIHDIAEWNKEVVAYKYWAKNPWTNWYFSQKVANNLKMIQLRTKPTASDFIFLGGYEQ